MMPLSTLERIFSQIFTSGLAVAPEVTVIWHSGEPLTLPPAYYDNAIERILAIREACARQDTDIRFEIQTNGVLISEAWCRFFKKHSAYLNVGVSCDGPPEMHDAFRLNWTAQPSHSRTVRGMDLLAAHSIRYKVIAVVTKRTLADPRRFFEFFLQRVTEMRAFHFNVLAEGDGQQVDLAYDEKDRNDYYDFYRRLLALSHASSKNGPKFEIQNFTQGFGRILAGDAGASAAGVAPLRSLNFDARGNVTTFYAGLSPETHADRYGDDRGLALGNILETTILDMAHSPKLATIVADFATSRRACESGCAYHSVCSGGFELTKLTRNGRYESTETPECIIHVKALTDALLDDVDAFLDAKKRESTHA